MQASGWAIGHHGEILQGVFSGDDRRLHRGLVTLPFTSRYSIAVAEVIEGDEVVVWPRHKHKARRAIEYFLREAAHDQIGIKLIVRSNIPEGFGLGSSTTDIVAAIRATANLFGRRLKPTLLFQLAVRTEAASDGTMFAGRPRLVCQREGTVLERFRRKLPKFSLISVNVAPDRPVDTLNYPRARYNQEEIGQFDELRRLLRRALRTGSLSDLGEVATRSAIINQRYLPQPHFVPILDLCRSKKTFGVQVAHSGRMVGILVDPSLDRNSKMVRQIQNELLRMNLFSEFLRSPHR